MTSFVIAMLVLAVVGVFLGVKVVPQGHRYTVERFGRFIRSAGGRLPDQPGPDNGNPVEDGSYHYLAVLR